MGSFEGVERPRSRRACANAARTPNQGTCATVDDNDGALDLSAAAVTVGADFAYETDFAAEYLSSWSSWAGLASPTTTPTAPSPTATWSITIYSDSDCSGDYYVVQVKNPQSLDEPCAVLHGGLTQDYSSPGLSCRWYTLGGGSWTSCDAGTLTHALSWQVHNGTCTCYDNDQCAQDTGSQAYYSHQGCINYNAGNLDVKNWVAVSCGY
ncbi:hypothetical protein BR93DRAFT_941894 [Coniochaeta sp. PMI_546]|nr:hypothetical protein BR93DRAFT_941894 [Coniochaeta sp. PMI_546]